MLPEILKESIAIYINAYKISIYDQQYNKSNYKIIKTGPLQYA